jgi:hypothetical protein
MDFDPFYAWLDPLHLGLKDYGNITGEECLQHMYVTHRAMVRGECPPSVICNVRRRTLPQIAMTARCDGGKQREQVPVEEPIRKPDALCILVQRLCLP